MSKCLRTTCLSPTQHHRDKGKRSSLALKNSRELASESLSNSSHRRKRRASEPFPHPSTPVSHLWHQLTWEPTLCPSHPIVAFPVLSFSYYSNRCPFSTLFLCKPCQSFKGSNQVHFLIQDFHESSTEIHLSSLTLLWSLKFIIYFLFVWSVLSSQLDRPLLKGKSNSVKSL